MKKRFVLVHVPVFMSDDFLSKEEAILEANKRWGEKIGSKLPLFFPCEKDELKLYQLTPGCVIDSIECIDLARKNKLFFPNAIGLVLLQKLDTIYHFIPNGAFVMGMDEKHNLHFEKHVGHTIPVLHKENDKYSYQSFPWNMKLENDDYLFLFQKG